MSNSHSIDDGLAVLKRQHAFHKAETEKYANAIAAFEQAVSLLGTQNGNGAGRPAKANDEEMEVIRLAAVALPNPFPLSTLRSRVMEDKGWSPDTWKRAFRESKDLLFVERQAPMGRRDGIYEKRAEQFKDEDAA